MPKTTSFGEQPGLDVAIGPVEQEIVPAATHGLASSIAASGSTVSNLLFADGYKVLAAGATSTQNGQIQVQRYLDDAGLVAQGGPVTGALTANTAGVVNVTDGAPFSSYKVTITNSGGSTATLTNVAILQQAQ
jgi:hypothetical protein